MKWITKFEDWFNEQFGWFFTNGFKKKNCETKD